ncbi:uncharacterized protein LOC120475674 [Pimephales promelas]|uniref:uncharacterized protein LOC120475674 n=1 Tax=Pimephales promelas TaxID=90988 RepID=UPI001955D393|nr:uncharacterized protein LOC120475674 [Pimephales promelas]
MKSSSNTVLFILLLSGVFGVADEVKTVSVMEGESVTLNTDPSKTQTFNLIEWRFGASGSVIADTDKTKSSYPYLTEIFEGRLHIDGHNGSLTIKNMRIKHSGLYKLVIICNSDTIYTTFSVTVSESPTDADIDSGEAEMKTVSVNDVVILRTDVNETHGDELIVWRFERKLIAKCDIEADGLTKDKDERFRDRLKLDNQTGFLTITDIRTTDSGVYTVKINSNKQTLYKKFNVTVSGLSSGAKAGIVFFVLLVFSAAAGVFHYRHIICSPKCLGDEESSTQESKP